MCYTYLVPMAHPGVRPLRNLLISPASPLLEAYYGHGPETRTTSSTRTTCSATARTSPSNPAPSPSGHPLLSGPPTFNESHQIFTRCVMRMSMSMSMSMHFLHRRGTMLVVVQVRMLYVGRLHHGNETKFHDTTILGCRTTTPRPPSRA